MGYNPHVSGASGCRWLLIRRNRRTGELAFYRCWSPHRVPLGILVKVAGLRWTIGELPSRQGPDRPGPAPGPPLDLRHRWVTLAMLAAAVLTIAAALEHARSPDPDGLIPLTRNEIARLLAATATSPARDTVPDALVTLATPPPAPLPNQPLPAATRLRRMNLTILASQP